MARVYGIDPHGIHSKVPQSNYEADATGATTLWPDTTHYKAEVPAGKIWWFWGGYQDGDAAETVVGTIKDASDNILFLLLSEANATVGYGYPDPALVHVNMPIPLLAGWYIELLYGGAQGAGAYACAVVTEVDAVA